MDDTPFDTFETTDLPAEVRAEIRAQLTAQATALLAQDRAERAQLAATAAAAPVAAAPRLRISEYRRALQFGQRLQGFRADFSLRPLVAGTIYQRIHQTLRIGDKDKPNDVQLSIGNTACQQHGVSLHRRPAARCPLAWSGRGRRGHVETCGA